MKNKLIDNISIGNYKIINNYKNYLIFKNGKVYNKKYHRFIKSRIKYTKYTRKDGTIKINSYRTINLYNNGACKQFLLHRLIAIHYIENPLKKPCVDHKNGKSLDNSINNLRWLTKSENNANRKTNGYSLYYTNRRCIKHFILEYPLDSTRQRVKRKSFLTKELAQEYADNFNFPLAKNYNVEF